MPRKFNLVVLLGIIVVVVLSFGISAAALPGDGAAPGGSIVPTESIEPTISVPAVPGVPTENAVPPAQTTTPELTAIPTETGAASEPVSGQGDGAALNQGVAPEDIAQNETTTASNEATAPTEESTTPESTTPEKEEAAPEEEVATGEEAATEAATPEEKTSPEEDVASESVESGELEFVEIEEAGETFEDMLTEAEAADGAYKNALSEENRLNNEIARTRADLTSAEDSLDGAQENLEDRASQIYKHGQENFVSVLLDAKDFRQFANLLGFWMQLLEEDQNEVQSWRESKSDLEQTTEELEAQLQSWETTREEATTKKEQAETQVEEAQEFFESLDREAQEEIQEQRESEAKLALDHAEKLIQQAAQNEPLEAAEKSENKIGDGEQVIQALEVKPEENVGSESQGPAEAEKAEERPPEVEQVRQVEVAQAVADTIREWSTIKEQAKQAAEQVLVDEETLEKQRAAMEEARPAPEQNRATEQMTAAAEKQAEAQEQARQAAEQTAKEKQAAEEAAARAEEAEKASQAAEQAPVTEQEKARSAAQEAQRQAEFAAELASKEKINAEETAKQAAERLTSAEEEINIARMAAEQAAANNPLAPKIGAAGAKPLPAGAGGGVLGEAKSWMGVPYDYSHMAGQTRKAVDCSAFTAAVYSKFGIMLPDSPIGQLGTGTPVSGTPKAGDLVFFSEDGSGTPTHVGIANGDGTLTHSSSFTGEVSVTDMDYINGYMGARRLL